MLWVWPPLKADARMQNWMQTGEKKARQMRRNRGKVCRNELTPAAGRTIWTPLEAPSSQATSNSLTSERGHLWCALPSHPLLAESYSVNFSMFLAWTFLSLTDPHSSGISRVGVGAMLLAYHVGLLSKTHGTVCPGCADIVWAKEDEHNGLILCENQIARRVYNMLKR